MCGCSQAKLIEQHETSAMTGAALHKASLLLHVERGWAPWVVGTNGFHWAVHGSK